MSNERREHDEATKDRVVELYESDVRLKEIVEKTGVPRSTVYHILRQRGVKRDRHGDQMPNEVEHSQEATLRWALSKLLEQEREIGRLRQHVEQLQAANQRLLEDRQR